MPNTVEQLDPYLQAARDKRLAEQGGAFVTDDYLGEAAARRQEQQRLYRRALATGNVLGHTPNRESLGTSIVRAPGRFLGGLETGLLIQPAEKIAQANAALADLFGNPELAESFRQAGSTIVRQHEAGGLGAMGAEGGFAAGAGELVGGIAPSAISLFTTGGASGPILAYYGIQSLGAGAQDYRETMIARGLKPDEVDALLVGIGYGSVEVVSEKLGLDIIGKKVTPKIAREISEAILERRMADAARITAGIATNATVEGLEEAFTQLTQNAIANTGLYTVDPFDPSRSTMSGVPEAFAFGAAGGTLLTAPALFSPQGRSMLKGPDRPPSRRDIEIAREAMAAFSPDTPVADLGEEVDWILPDSFVDVTPEDYVSPDEADEEATGEPESVAAPEAGISEISPETQETAPEPAESDEGPEFALPDDLDTLTLTELEDSVEYLRIIISEGMDPETNQDLSQPEIEQAQSLLTVLSSKLEAEYAAEQQAEDAAEPVEPTEQQPTGAELRAEQDEDRTAGTPGATVTPPDSRQPPVSPQPTARPIPLRLARPTFSQVEATLDEWLDVVPGPLSQVEDELLNRGEQWSYGRGTIDREWFAIEPDEYEGLSPQEKRQFSQRANVTEEAQPLREFLGDALYEAAKDEAIHGKAGRRRKLIADLLESPEHANPNLVMAAFLHQQITERQPERRRGGTTKPLTDEQRERRQQRERRKTDLPEMEFHSPAELGPGARFTIFGVEFETIIDDEGRLLLATEDGFEGNILASELNEVPIDLDSITYEPLTAEEIAAREAKEDAWMEAAMAAPSLRETPQPAPLPPSPAQQAAAEEAAAEEPDQGKLYQYLDRVAQRAKENMAERERPMTSQQRGAGGARGGSAPIFGDIFDATVYISARALQRGILGGRALTQMVRAFIHARAPHLHPHLDLIIRNVRKLVTHSIDPETNRVDPAKFEQALTKLRDNAMRRTGQARQRPVKTRIREAIIGPKQEPTITERDALKASLKAQQRTARILIAQGKAQLSNLRLAMKAQKRADDATLTGFRTQLARIAKEHLPKSEQGRLLNDVANVRTMGQLAKGVRKVREALTKHEHDIAVREFKATMRSFQLGKLRPEYRDAIIEATGEIDLKKLDKTDQSRLQTLVRFLRVSPETLLPATMIEELDRLALKYAGDTESFTTDELRTLTNGVRHALKMNEMVNVLIRKGRAYNANVTANSVAREISTTMRERRELPSGDIAPEQERGIWRLPWSQEANFKPDLMAERMSGGEHTDTHRIWYDELNAAADNRLGRYQHAQDALTAAVEAAGLQLGSRDLATMSRLLAPRYGRAEATIKGKPSLAKATKAEILTIRLSKGRTIKMTRGDRMYLRATLQDVATRDLILFEGVPIKIRTHKAGQTYTLTQADVQAILNHGDAAKIRQEEAIVDSLMRYINTELKEAISQWSVWKLGYDITHEALYFPRHRAGIVADKQAMTSTQYIQQTLSSVGYVQERLDDRTSPIEIRDIFSEFNNLAWASYSLSELEPALTTARKTLENPNVRDAIRNTRGSKLLAYWQSHFDELARESVGGPTLRGPTTGFVNDITNRLTVGLLGLNPRVWMYQPASLLLASTEIPERYILKAVGTASMLNSRIDDRMRAGSPRIRARIEASAHGLLNEAGGPGQMILGFKPKNELFMRGISACDRMAIRAIWRASELQVRAEMPNLTGDAYVQAVRTIAERTINRTQPVFDTMHMSGIALEGRRNAWVRAATMFHSQRNQNINMVARSAIRASRDSSRANRLRQMKNVSLVIIGQTAFIMGIKELWQRILGKDEDEDDKSWRGLAADFADVTISNLYFGEPISFLTQVMIQPDRRMYGSDFSAISGVIEDTLRAGWTLRKNADLTDPKFWNATIDLAESISAASGVPFTAAFRMARDFVENQILSDDNGGGSSAGLSM